MIVSDVLDGRKRWAIEQAEAISRLGALPSERVDALVADPPYSSGGMTSADRNRPARTKYSQSGSAIYGPAFEGDNRDQRAFFLWCRLWLRAQEWRSRPFKRPENLKPRERGRLRALVTINFRSARAYLLKEQFNHFWTYQSSLWAQKFLARWTTMAMRSRLDPFKRVAKTLRKHRRELLNWLVARGQFAHGATEGFNNKARITTRKAYGFRTYEHTEIALYHALGNLPEPPWLTHGFC